MFSDPSCPAGQIRYWSTGKDFFGNDIETHDDIATVEECMELCRNNDLCNAFTFHPSGYYANRCWLKAKDAQTGSWTVNQRTDKRSTGHKCDYDFRPEQTDEPTGIYPASG